MYSDALMYQYWAYGLTLRSEVALPELVTAEAPSADLTIFRREHIRAREMGTIDGGGRFLGRVEGVGHFGLIEGHTIFAQPFSGVEASRLRTVLLGPILSIALRQRGCNVLHAGCVVIQGQAIAFIGRSGAGKSTTTASFYERGYSVIADDVVPVTGQGDRFMVDPGYPQIKLHDDAAAVLYGDVERLPALHRSRVRRLKRASRDFRRVPFPLRKVYVLEYGETMQIAPLSEKEALGVVMQNTRAIPPLEHPDFKKAHFDECARLVQNVPVAVLQRPRSLDLLPDLVTRVERDINIQSGWNDHAVKR